MQGVSAVTYHNAVNAICNLVTYGLCKYLVLVRAHVLTEDGKKLLGAYVAHICQLRHRTVELARRESRDDCSGPVIEPRGNCAAGAK